MIEELSLTTSSHVIYVYTYLYKENHVADVLTSFKVDSYAYY